MFYKDCNDLLIEWCASGSHAWGSAVRTPSRPQLGVFEACLGMVCQGYLLPKKSPQPIEWPNVNLPPIRSVSAIFDNSVWVLICRRFEAWWICRPVQNTKYDLSYLFVIFGALVCDSYCRCFLRASTCSSPLSCNTRGEGHANVHALPSSRGIPGRPQNLSHVEGRKGSHKGPASDLGESLNACIPARILLPQIKLTFIIVYGGM